MSESPPAAKPRVDGAGEGAGAGPGLLERVGAGLREWMEGILPPDAAPVPVPVRGPVRTPRGRPAAR
jgi:hypothetical protein